MSITPSRLRAAGPIVLACVLAACAGTVADQAAHAGPSGSGSWPPTWNVQPSQPFDDVVRFEPPSASHCRRLPGTREVAGGARWRIGAESRLAREAEVAGAVAPAPEAPAVASADARAERDAEAAAAPAAKQAATSANATCSR